MDTGSAHNRGARLPDHPGTPAVLVAIANHGEHGVPLTAHAAAAALRQSGDFNVRVIVVDDGSGSVVVEALRSAITGAVELVAMPQNRGYAAACNEGIRRARDASADYVWLLNNDIDMPPDTLTPLLDTLERRAGWAAVAPVTVDPRPPFRILGAGVTIDRVRARVRHLFAGQPQASLPAEPYVVEGIEGAALLVRLAAIDTVGELDETYWMYWEDTDWSVRARSAGWRVGVDPRSRVAHLVSQSTSNEQRTELMVANRIRFADKMGTPVQRLLFRIYFILGWLPLYTIARLIPRFGVRAGARMSGRLLLRALRLGSTDERVS